MSAAFGLLANALSHTKYNAVNGREQTNPGRKSLLNGLTNANRIKQTHLFTLNDWQVYAVFGP